MIDIVFRIDPDNKAPSKRAPRDAGEARALLDAGNETFANLYRHSERDQRHAIPLDARALGLSEVAGQAPKQTPFAVVLGHCNCGAVTTAVDAFLQPAHYLALASIQGFGVAAS